MITGHSYSFVTMIRSEGLITDSFLVLDIKIYER